MVYDTGARASCMAILIVVMVVVVVVVVGFKC